MNESIQSQKIGTQELLDEKIAFLHFRNPGSSFTTVFPADDGEYFVSPRNGDVTRFGENSDSRLQIETSELPAETSLEAYKKAFERYKRDIGFGEVRKAILSAVIREKLPKGFNALTFAEALSIAYPNAFVYLLNHPRLGLWCGASPEVLLKGKKGRFQTMALAGTKGRKPAGAYDWSEKERDEQALVSEHIRKALSEMGITELEESETYTSEAGDVVHLKTDFSFHYSGDPLNIVKRLHPTPAVEGIPLDSSGKLIDRAEIHDRKLYTGYLGKIDRAETNVFVNLRCMQIGKEEAAIYVGGGITEKSELLSEWEETRLKAKTLLNLFKP